MLNSLNLHKLEEKPSDGPPAGGGMPLPPAAAPPVPPVAAQPPAAQNPPPTEEGGDKFDQYGYEKDPAAAPKEGDPPAAPKVDDPEKVADPATGYSEDPPKVDPPATPPAEPPVIPPADDVDKALDGLVKEEAAKIKEFVKKHGVSTEVAKAFAEMRKQEMKDAEAYTENSRKEAEQNTLRLKAAWHKELKEDATFGGEKFAKNVQNVEKVMAEFMPLTKKQLTERKAMLPPYLMRDLAKIADHLFSTEKLVQGDPGVPAKVVKESGPLDFYE